MRMKDAFRFVGYTLLIALVVAIVSIGFASLVEAQTIKPRKPTASAPAPKAGEKKVEETKPAESETPTGLTIVGELPKQVEGGRRVVTNLEVKGGKPPYDWTFDGPTNNDIAWAYAFNHAEDDKDRRKSEFVWWATMKSGPAEVKISVSDSTTTPTYLEVTRVFRLLVQPMVVSSKDIYDQASTTRKYAQEMRDSMYVLRQDLVIERAKAYRYADQQIAAPNARADLKIAQAKDAALGYLRRIESSVENMATVLGIILVLTLIGIGFVCWKVGALNLSAHQVAAEMIDGLQRLERKDGEHGSDHPRGLTNLKVIGFFALSLFAASIVHAAEPAKAAIKSVVPQVLVKEQDPVLFTFTATKGSFADVTAIELGAGVKAEELKAATGKVTAKISADTTASTGPTSFNLVRKDGSKVESGEKVVVRVMDVQTADVRKELLAEIAVLRKQNKTASGQLAATENRTMTAVAATAEAVRTELGGQVSVLRSDVGNVSRVANAAVEAADTALEGAELALKTRVVKSKGIPVLNIGGKTEAVDAEAAAKMQAARAKLRASIEELALKLAAAVNNKEEEK